MDNALEARIKKMVSDCTAVPEKEILLSHRLFDDLGMDSVSAMELIGMLDEELEMELAIEETVEIRTVQHVFDIASRHVDHAP